MSGPFSDLTAVVECERGHVFVKAQRNKPGGRRDSIIREELISPAVRPVSPRLLWVGETENWIVLGFEVVDGRHADLKPDSPDLPMIIDLINRMSSLPMPEFAKGWHNTRMDRYTRDPAEVDLLRGDALLHADINHTNILVGEGLAWAVDWGWPVRGAAWVDAAQLVIQLVAAGHSPESAEAWAARCGTWRAADPKALDAYAAACTRMWWQRSFQRPDRTARKALAQAAEAWANHRGVVVR
jgi:hypothetical protein